MASSSEYPSIGDCRVCGKSDKISEYRHCESCNSDVKCPNYSFCNNIEPVWVMKFCHGGYCMGCQAVFKNTPFYNKTLEFKPLDPKAEACSVCMTSETTTMMMKFPVKDCTHWFCVKCSKDILFGDETRAHLDPRLFGCPPCPNGCNNPTVGRQCYCEEYDFVQDLWEAQEPMQFRQWNDAEHYSIETTKTGFGTQKCPLCRRHIHDS
jgi:hypothetical protein